MVSVSIACVRVLGVRFALNCPIKKNVTSINFEKQIISNEKFVFLGSHSFQNFGQ